MHTPMRRTGSFECSSAALNQLYSNIIWGQKGNYLEMPTDCPQRDERMGWTGDTQFFAPTAAYNFDVAAFFTRWLTTCEDNQNADGTFPHVVPDIMGGGGATAWGDAALICTYNVYRSYGDTRIIVERFAALERYMQWLATKTKNGISKVGGFGDWLNAGGGAKSEVIDTAYHAYLAQIMSEMARAIGRNDDAERYARLHEEVKAAFVREFLQEDGSLKECSQTGYALAFSMNLLPADMRAKAAAKFVDEIKRFDWHLATGFIGTPRLLPALNAAGRNDVAYRLAADRHLPVVAVSGKERGHDHVGTLEWLDAGRVRRYRHEFIQPLRIWRGGRVSVWRRRRYSSGESGLQNHPDPAGDRRRTDVGEYIV